MEQYLFEFQTEAAYNQARPTLNRPSVSYLTEPNLVKYDRYEVAASVGDYLFSDKSFSPNLVQGKTPIAICVAPASHFTNQKARWISLVNMSATDPEHGTVLTGNDSSTNPGAGFCWGASGSITGLTENGQLPTLVCEDVNEPQSNLSNNLVIHGYVPSDHLNSSTIQFPVSYPLDSRYNYYGDDYDLYAMKDSEYGPIPSPFNQDGSLNSWARREALSNVSGSAQTTSIISVASKYTTGEITRDDSDSGSYPAAVACHRFSTAGTQAGDWYLPSIAELMYVIVHLELINTKLDNLSSSTAVKIGDNLTYENYGNWLWSSSAYSSSSAWPASTNNCCLSSRARNTDQATSRVRAFLEL